MQRKLFFHLFNNRSHCGCEGHQHGLVPILYGYIAPRDLLPPDIDGNQLPRLHSCMEDVRPYRWYTR